MSVEHKSRSELAETVRDALNLVTSNNALYVERANVALDGLVEQLEAARDLILNVDGPWDIDQDCKWCSGHYDYHEPTCVWARAMDALGLPNLGCDGKTVLNPAIVQDAAGENPDAAGGNSGRSAPSPATVQHAPDDETRPGWSNTYPASSRNEAGPYMPSNAPNQDRDPASRSTTDPQPPLSERPLFPEGYFDPSCPTHFPNTGCHMQP